MRKDKKKVDKKAKEKVTIVKTNMEILPIRYYDSEADCYALENGSYLGFFEKTSADIANSMEDEVQYDMLLLAKFLKLYRADIKIVALNFPVNTARQRIFLEKKIEQTNNPIKKQWLKRSIKELSLLDINSTKREYYIFYYSDSLEEHAKNTK
ncbi:MAG: hypothetical protein ACRCUS_08470, partial [Anaerovoracaceae bacterium]